MTWRSFFSDIATILSAHAPFLLLPYLRRVPGTSPTIRPPLFFQGDESAVDDCLHPPFLRDRLPSFGIPSDFGTGVSHHHSDTQTWVGCLLRRLTSFTPKSFSLCRLVTGFLTFTCGPSRIGAHAPRKTFSPIVFSILIRIPD